MRGQLGGRWVVAVLFRAPEQDCPAAIIRSYDIADQQPASGAELAQFFSEIAADGLLAVAVAPNLMEGAVADGRVDRAGLEYAVEQVAVEKVDVGPAELPGVLALVEAAGELG